MTFKWPQMTLKYIFLNSTPKMESIDVYIAYASAFIVHFLYFWPAGHHTRLSLERLTPKCSRPQKSILRGRNTLDNHQSHHKSLGLYRIFPGRPLDKNLTSVTHCSDSFGGSLLPRQKSWKRIKDWIPDKWKLILNSNMRQSQGHSN